MNYEDIIKNQENVLVEFYASWCPHCQKMMPIVEQIKELLADQISVYQFDIDENQSLAGHEDVDTIPTFILYSNGREVWRHSGEMSADTLLGKIQSHITTYA